MSNPSLQRFLVAYSGLLTGAFVVFAASGFQSSKSTTFDEITVHRINVVEPDGTLRMTLSNKASFPGVIIKGQERPHPTRSTAGMLFFNDEGTENGGLIFGGAKDKSGVRSSFGHLSFDRYEQDQTFAIESNEEGKQRDAGLSLIDQPDYPIQELMDVFESTKGKSKAIQDRTMAAFLASHSRSSLRLYLGRSADGSVGLNLRDKKGRPRLVIKVDADGSPEIEFLDTKGRVARRFVSVN